MNKNLQPILNNKRTAEIDLTSNGAFIVKNGHIVPLDNPISGYGEQVVIWLGGNIDRVETKNVRKV